MATDLEAELARWRRVTGAAEPPAALLASLDQLVADLTARPLSLWAELLSLGRPVVVAATLAAAAALLLAASEARDLGQQLASVAFSDSLRAG
jgi:hypothetical protein